MKIEPVFERYCQRVKERAEAELEALAHSYLDGAPTRLVDAIRHSLFSGGKRVRPLVASICSELVGGSIEDAARFGAAIEMIHAYTLIHDDLPALDNDDYRRGAPSCHIAFDEASAILAGDALLSMAARALTDRSNYRGDIRADLILTVATETFEAIGPRGMVGGQIVDMSMERQPGDPDTLEYIHQKKTGALFQASAVGGARLAGADEAGIASMRLYGAKLGALFQLTDDMLDLVGQSREVGKPLRSDAKKGKLTYLALHTIDEARQAAEALEREAVGAIDRFDGEEAEIARTLARSIRARKK